MAQLCARCAVSFAGPAELIAHVKKAHAGDQAEATLAMNPESQRPGVVCALCGRRFASANALRRHNLAPHVRPASPGASFSPATARFC